jgi:hypothetical protein
MGSGGYKTSVPQWDKKGAHMIARESFQLHNNCPGGQEIVFMVMAETMTNK